MLFEAKCAKSHHCIISEALQRAIIIKLSFAALFYRNIPENYKVLFLQGGGTGQFAAVPLNLGKGL